MLVEPRDKALAADIRAAVAGAGNENDFPRAVWWRDIEKSAGLQAVDAKETELAAFERRCKAEGVVSRIPAEARFRLGLLHGASYFARIAADWEAQQAQRQPKQNSKMAQR